ncbi:MAG: alpha/beta hydrolase [Leptospirales bacterium]
MKFFKSKFFKFSIAGLLILIASPFLLYEYAQSQMEDTLEIKSANGIEEYGEIEINGLKQWVLIRSEDKNNPVFLFLSGGPGFTEIPFMHHNKELEKHFVMVYWDQRGAGKTYSQTPNPERMQFEDYINDTVFLIEYLKNKFNVAKVYAAGHSWGTTLGILVAQRRPELFHAFVAISLVLDLNDSDKYAYTELLERAKLPQYSQYKESIVELGPPPYKTQKDIDELGIFVNLLGGGIHNGPVEPWLYDKGIPSPYYELNDYRMTVEALTTTWGASIPEYYAHNLLKEVPEINIPLYICAGRDDLITPYALAHEYYEKVKAKAGKHFYSFESSAHFVHLEESEKYQDILIHEVKK